MRPVAADGRGLNGRPVVSGVVLVLAWELLWWWWFVSDGLALALPCWTL